MNEEPPYKEKQGWILAIIFLLIYCLIFFPKEIFT